MRSAFLYQQIAEALRHRIASGQLQPGDRLPPIREMAGRWECTTGTVSRAYGLLAEEGLVAAHRGSGTRVAQHPLQKTQSTSWRWASVVNKAEHFLLAALADGFSPSEAESALTVAVARWNAIEHPSTLPGEAAEAAPADGHLRFSGSHDLLLEILARSLAEADPVLELEMKFNGSLGGLMALARGEADVAGVHLWDVETGLYNEPFVQRILPGRHLGMITLAHRSLGLIVAPENPRQIQTLADLVRPEVQFVNRQQGSGTRVWLDASLRSEGIEPDRINGYEKVRTTHTEVAKSVSQGEAAVGLGIYAAAAAYGLDFLELTRERYDLVFREPVWGSDLIDIFRRQIRSPNFLQSVRVLGGYDTAETGRERVL